MSNERKADATATALLSAAIMGVIVGANASAILSWWTSTARHVGSLLGLDDASSLDGEECETQCVSEKKNQVSLESMYLSEAERMSKDEVLALRETHFCDAQSISYKNTEPLMAMHLEMQFIVDDAGVRYLDSRNNVGHCGWAHPRVVKAVQKQQAECNASSRYVHPARALLAKKLTSRLPSKLNVVFFVNSGSEANDLALRLARQHTRNRDVIVVDRAYHGHTAATLSLSPYKYEHTGGESYAEPWVHKVSCPDIYRGEFRDPSTAASHYAEEVRASCANSQDGVAAFFIESGMSVAGVILPPKGYLQECYAHVRAAGGVCVADEVQTGFGRFGSSFWGFEEQGVIPDIVTMGKPFGNGFPLSAVVTTREVADSFSNGLEYFNTFGGNPVACAAGLAVLETIECEQLQEHAKHVGNHLMARLRRVISKPPDGSSFYVGDVRGSGLFIGVEFVKDKLTKEPATRETSLLCSYLKDKYRILTSIDGRHDNVIVIKPPMCFTKGNADALVDAILEIIPTITDKELASATHTST